MPVSVIVFSFHIVDILTSLLLLVATSGRLVLWDSPERFHILKSDNLYEDWTLGILCFYLLDFLRYWGHRIGHNKPFYKTFPLTRKLFLSYICSPSL